MDHKVIPLHQAPISFREISEEKIRMAVHAAVAQSGRTGFKNFLSDYKQHNEDLKQVA